LPDVELVMSKISMGRKDVFLPKGGIKRRGYGFGVWGLGFENSPMCFVSMS